MIHKLVNCVRVFAVVTALDALWGKKQTNYFVKTYCDLLLVWAIKRRSQQEEEPRHKSENMECAIGTIKDEGEEESRSVETSEKVGERVWERPLLFSPRSLSLFQSTDWEPGTGIVAMWKQWLKLMIASANFLLYEYYNFCYFPLCFHLRANFRHTKKTYDIPERNFKWYV